MTAKTLTFGPDLALPAEDFVERATALIAKRGRGKTGGVKVIEEGLLVAGLPFVVFDPVGVHWGLRSTFDGKKPSGHEVLVIGGAHGDLPLDRKAGRAVARSIADTGISLIIDFKGASHAAYREFVADFADELLNINGAPRLLIFEEAPRLLPQRLRPDQTVCFDAVLRLILEGRNAGLGCLLVSQRAATLNKDALTQVDNLVIMGLTGPQDRKAVEEWVEENAEPEKLGAFLAGLSSLQPRQGWLWAPDMGIFQAFRFRDFKTFHPDRTHLRRHGMLKTKPAQTDMASLVERLGADMKALAEKAKADDPAALRKQMRDMAAAHEKELMAANRRAANAEGAAAAKVEEVPVLSKADRDLLALLGERMVNDEKRLRIEQQLTEGRRQEAADLVSRIERLLAPTPKPASVVAALHPLGRPQARPKAQQPMVRLKQPVAKVPQHVIDGTPRQHQRILDALAYLESVGITEPTRAQAALAAEVSAKSSATERHLAAMVAAGLIRYPREGCVSLTAEGRGMAQAPESPPTVEALQESLLRRCKPPQAALLRVCIKHHPGHLTREEAASQAGMSAKSSATERHFAALRSVGLITYPGEGLVAAAPAVFMEA